MRGQTAVILGLGRQGIALARYLAERGVSVRASDLRPSHAVVPALKALREYQLDFVLGEHPQSLLDGADIIFVSGGVPTDIPLLHQARERGITLSNDSQLFLEKAPCKVVGVTGSAGKTTVTLLTGRIAAACGRFQQVWAGGNVGNPLLADVHRMTPQDVAIMELSSFQLEIMTTSPTVAAILNITPNHLDRHGTMQEYVEVKAHILDGQRSGDVAVLGWDDETARGLRDRVRGHCWGFGLGDGPDFVDGCHLDGERIMLRRGGVSLPFATGKDIKMRGSHNKLNVLAAAALAAAVGVDPAVMPTAIRGFAGAPHRMELVREANRVRWVNDTMATTPERTVAALQSFTVPVILLLGGRDKKLPWGDLAERVKTGVKAIVLFGESAALIEREVGRAWLVPPDKQTEAYGNGARIADGGSGDDSGSDFSNAVEAAANGTFPTFPELIRVDGLEEAVRHAAASAEAGDVVLLSPGCASFDDFSDASERGDRFRELVQALS